MKLKCAIAALAVTFAASAVAAACPSGHKQRVMSCADGHVWDAQTGSCMPQTTS